MRTASWILATHNRPRLLFQVIAELSRQYIPYGWRQEIVVCTSRSDPGWVIAKDFANQVVTHESIDPGRRLTAALMACKGELVLVTSDDDFPARKRLLRATQAYEMGMPCSGQETFLFLRRDWQVSQWTGPPQATGALNWKRSILVQVGGWPDGTLTDFNLMKRLGPISIQRLDSRLAKDTICTHGWGNLSPNRPFPAPGEAVQYGRYRVLGLGCAFDLGGRVAHLAAALKHV